MDKMQQGDRAAIVACSNGMSADFQGKLQSLSNVLRKIGLETVCSEYIFAKESCFSGTAKERADALMDFYKNDEIKVIFDVSGGDMANEILPYLDFDIIAHADKQFWGYSDLTTIINAIYTKTGKSSVLYQIRNLIYDHAEEQTENFRNTVMKGKDDLLDFSCFFVQGSRMRGTVVGGNIRCFLKLAGTEYFPDVDGKVLLLEAYGGTIPQMVTYLSQLKMMNVFERINGIILGTFTKMEAASCKPDITELVKEYAGGVPIVKTQEIGHAADSKGILIGREICLKC